MNLRPARLRLLFCLLLPLGLSACIGAPMRELDEPSLAYDAPEKTALWQTLVPPGEVAAGHSGFFFLEAGLDAYQTRLTLIEAAEKTIDIQYYIWEFDGSGRAISEALLRAADRGVRVRALVDGFLVDNDSVTLLRIAAHPNVEVRIYNALRMTFRKRYLQYGEVVLDMRRLNHRMHNKIIAVDNAVSVIGGRNVSDAYFALEKEHYFLDRDVVIAGPLTRDVSASFDAFWNSRYAVPVERFAEGGPRSFDFASLWQEAFPLDLEAFPLRRRAEPEEMRISLADFRGRLVWAPGSLCLTSPGEVFAEQAPPPESSIENVFLRRIREAREKITIQEPYVMLTEEREKAFAAAHRRGVVMKLNTNSLASQDSALVHHGYARDRFRFIKSGVTLYEMKNKPATSGGMPGLDLKPEKTTLHSKTAVFDSRYILVGSFNLDHRSIYYNSEIGVLIDSPKLASRVEAAIEADMKPENSWRVRLEPPRTFVWLDESTEPPKRLPAEPHTGALAQMGAWVGYFLPIDSLL